ncbi:hypothetical protein [Actinokineospora sp. NPDC004072]
MTSEELRAILHDDGLAHGERMHRLSQLTGVEGCVTEALAKAFAERVWRRFELYLLAAVYHAGPAATPILCDALAERSRAVPNEDVLEVLAELGDPASLDCLRRTMYWRPEWDEFDQVGVKALLAISTVNTETAWKLIAEAVSRGSPAVSTRARQLLERYSKK